MKIFEKPYLHSGATTLGREFYTSRDIFEREQTAIFSKEWICIGRSEQIAKSGDYIVAEVAGESAIVVRDRTDRIHAFFNVCRHRGTRICETASGHFAGSIQCPYHAWTYGLDGELLVARNMESVPEFDRGDFPLKAVRSAEFEGFVFVNLDADAPAFEKIFAPLLGRFSRWQIARLETARTMQYELQCNWKLVFQNYSECYHCPVVHPQLDKLSPSDSGRNDLSEGPFLGGYSELRPNVDALTASGRTNRAPFKGLPEAEHTRVYYYTIFPSMLLSLHPDYVMVHYVRPLDTNRTGVVCAFLFDPDEIRDPNFDPNDAVEFWDLTNRQDWHVNELTQAGVQSRSYTPGPYSHAEGLLAAFDRHYLSVVKHE